MFTGLRASGASPVLLMLLMATSQTGCVRLPEAASDSDVRALRVALASLSPRVSDREAGQVAWCAYDYPRVLAAEYRVVRPAALHNCLINTGFKKRGLCYQWTGDLLAQLQTLDLESLELRWGAARAQTVREHNSVVVTAVGQPFEEGIVLDPWRRSGRLVWAPVSADKYPWVENQTPPLPSTGLESPARLDPRLQNVGANLRARP